jgi:hypothetical protein
VHGYYLSGLFAYQPMTTMMIKPITNAVIEAPSVTPDTLPLIRYSPIMDKEEPKRIMIKRMMNFPLVNNFGSGGFSFGDSVIGWVNSI